MIQQYCHASMSWWRNGCSCQKGESAIEEDWKYQSQSLRKAMVE